MNIGNAIKLGLLKKGISQKQLALKMGVRTSTVSQWVNGHSFPPGDKLVKLAKILGIKDQIFGEEDTDELFLEKPIEEEIKEIKKVEKKVEQDVDELKDAVRKIADHIKIDIKIGNSSTFHVSNVGIGSGNGGVDTKDNDK